MTMEEFLNRWLENCKTRISEHTGKQLNRRSVEEYGKIIKNHIKPAIGQIKVQELTPRQVRNLIESKIQDSQFTARKIYVILNSAFKQAIVDEELDLQSNVCTKVTAPKVRKVKHPVWSAEQAVKFLETVKHQPEYGLFLILIHNSLRIGEALGLTWADIDLMKGTTRLRQKLVKAGSNPIFEDKLKTEASETVIVLTPTVIQELRKIRIRQKEDKLAWGKIYQDYNLIFTNVIGSPVHLENLRRRVFNPTIVKAGLPKIRIHDLRHSSGTLLYKIFKDMRLVQRYLRHTKLSTTADIYVHDDDDIEMLQKAANEMAKALRTN